MALALPLPVAIAGCGGDDESSDDPAELLEQAFNNDTVIESGVIDLTFDLTAEGEMAGSLTAAVTGPFQTDPEDPESMGQVDLDVSVTAEGSAAEDFGGFEGGLIVTEDNLFVETDGTTYELGEEQFTALEEQAAAQAETAEGEEAAGGFREQCETAIEAQGGDPAACDFDVTAWFGELTNEGTEDLGGSDVTHIAGQLQLETVLTDLFGLISSIPGATGDIPPELIQGQLDTVTSAISDASFDAYPATEDQTLRGLDFNLALDPTAVPGGEAAGIDSAAIALTYEVSDVGSEQTFEAPADAEPIEGLFEQFGGSIPGGGALPGLPGATEPGGTVPGGEVPGGGAVPGAGEIDPVCLQEATTAEEIQACIE